MTWTALGSLTLTKDWQLINTASIGATIFRINQSWDVYPKGVVGCITQVYFDTNHYQGIRFYPNEIPKIINLLIPEDFLKEGINTRYLALKFIQRRTFTFRWNIQVDEFS